MRRLGAKPADHEPYPAEIQAIRKRKYGIAGFCDFAAILGVEVHGFQKYLLRFYFAGVTELVILIPKKNGKTTLLAVLALYHLLMVKNAEAVIGASSREQAALLHRQATTLILEAGLEVRALPGDRREPTRYAGVFEVREGMHVIRFETGRLRVMPHEARTGDGVIPTLALVDELHRHPTGELYRVWRNGLLEGAQMITISTAGESLDSPLGGLLEAARTFAMTQVVKRRTYTSPNGSFVLVEYALDPDDDPDDIGLVKKANPAPWLTPRLLRERHDSPMESPGSWARLACNLWMEGDEPAVTGPEWDRLKADIGQVREGDEVVLVPSVGHNAAIAVASMREGDRVAVHVEVIEPNPQTSIYDDAADRIVEMCRRYDVREIRHPLLGFLRVVDRLADRIDVKMREDPHSAARGTAATGTFETYRRSGRLIHDGDPELRKHVLAAQIKTTETGERYLASDRSRGQFAAMFAVHAATAYHPEPDVLLPTGALG